MTQDVFIMGAPGGVGSTLVSQIFDKGDASFARHKNSTRIIGAVSKTRLTNNDRGLTEKTCKDFSARVFKGGELKGYEHLKRIADELEKPVTFVDVTTGGKGMLDFHLHLIRNTHHSIVTANKLPLVLATYDEFNELTRDVKRYGYRCSVMAGAEAVDKIRDLRDLGDKIRSIEGCFSGSCGYILTRVEEGLPFSLATREAHEKGFTEPHPRDDLSGEDIARKLLILTRTAGYDVDYADIQIEPLVSEELFTEEDPERFIRLLEEEGIDLMYKGKVEGARSRGNVLRCIPRMKLEDSRLVLSSRLEEVPMDSPFGILRGTTNKIVITTDTYNEEVSGSYIVEAPGAGLVITAQNVRRDLLDQLDGRRVTAA